ncbi:MAG: hypothetical protein AB8B57_00980 [Congregibacter sp.]
MNTLRVLVLAADASTTESSASNSGELGFAFADRLQGIQPPNGDMLRAIGDTELRVEHALCLQSCALAIFVDAHPEVPEPMVFEELSLASGHHLDSMNGRLAPIDIMHALKMLTRLHEAPECFQLSLQSNADNIVSEETLNAAVSFVESLLEDADLERWRSLITRGNNKLSVAR